MPKIAATSKNGHSGGSDGKAVVSNARAAAPGSVGSAAKRIVKPTAAEISHRAYEIYERDGRPEGQQDAHWAQAEAELLGTK